MVQVFRFRFLVSNSHGACSDSSLSAILTPLMLEFDPVWVRSMFRDPSTLIVIEKKEIILGISKFHI